MESNPSKKTAVIFGATGLTGMELLNFLADDNRFEKVIAVVRREIDLPGNNTQSLLLDTFKNVCEISDQLRADIFFICTGTTIKKAGSKQAFREVDYEIPVAIAKCAELLRIPVMVVISSIGADSRSANFYLKTKGEMEQDLSKIYTGKLRFIRPSLLLGKRNEFRAGEYFASLVMRSLDWILIGSLKKYRGVKATEVARQLIELGTAE